MVVPVYFCYFSTATLITSFILYLGLKASAVTLITMVLGFLTTCLGITLLQMSKVDPNTLTKLDRKSTILMQASRQHTEEAEKGHVSALEDPGMDALRSGFGAVGSIIRARSNSRRMSNASSLYGQGVYGQTATLYDAQGNLSTRGLNDVQRYQRRSSLYGYLGEADPQYLTTRCPQMQWTRSRCIASRTHLLCWHQRGQRAI
jgi:hypothetical protein